MKVLSLFDGMSCGQLALGRAGVKVHKYAASEIDKYAIKIAQTNYPETEQVGDVRNINVSGYLDLLIAGSPCQGFSFAGKQLNFEDERSALFFEFVRILKEARVYNPDVKFLLENVKMKKEFQKVITDLLGVEPIEINSALVSAQNRKRLYWTNIPGVEQPKDRGIYLKDIVLDGNVDRDKSYCITSSVGKTTSREYFKRHQGGLVLNPESIKKFLHSEKALAYMAREVKGGRNHWDFKHHSDVRNQKSAAVVANFFKGVPYNVLKDWDCIRKFHPIECERLQTVPDEYTYGVSNTQRYKMLGNGWTIDVIAHIFKGLKQ